MSEKEVVKVQEIEIPCMMAEDGHLITGKTAYKGPVWSEDNPTANLLCPSCSEVLDDRTGRQVKLDNIRVMVAAMVVEDPAEATVVIAEAAKVVVLTPDEVEVGVVPAKPRFCSLCGEPIPPEHKYPLHERCYISTKVVREVGGREEAEQRIKQARYCVDEQMPKISEKLLTKRIIKQEEGLDLTIAGVFYEKALVAYEARDFLKAVRLAWLAKDAAAIKYDDIMHPWLARQVDELRNEGFLQDEDPLAKFMVEVEVLIGEGKYLPAFYMLNGNHQKGQPGAMHRVGLTWQTPKAKIALVSVQEAIVTLGKLEADVPADAGELCREAKSLYVDDPWGAERKAKDAYRILERAVWDAEAVAQAKFVAGMRLGVRALANAAPEDVDELEELVGEQSGVRDSETRRRGDGKGLKRVNKPEKEFRGGRGDQRRQMIDEALTVEPVPA